MWREVELIPALILAFALSQLEKEMSSDDLFNAGRAEGRLLVFETV